MRVGHDAGRVSRGTRGQALRENLPGFGIAKNDDDDGRQKNRRCELVVSPSVEEMLDLKAITQ